MKKIWICSLLGLISCLGLRAQELTPVLITNLGGVQTNGSTEVIFGVGESMVFTTSNGTLTLTEGFCQPLMSSPGDSIWPGDANRDQVVNNIDVLALGLAYGTDGPPRPGASLDFVPQAGDSWQDTLPGAINFKHADTGGNGTINADDTLAIDLNYGLVSNKGAGGQTDGLPLIASFVEDTLMVGDTAEIAILLGTDTLQALDVYGLAFSLQLDTSLVQSDSYEIIYENSWLGAPGADLLPFHKILDGGLQVDLALTRINQQNQSGYGRIATVTVVMIDDLSGKSELSEVWKPVLSHVFLMNREGESLPVNSQADSLLLTDGGTTSLAFREDIGIELFPNPATNWLTIKTGSQPVRHLRVFNRQGQMLHQQEVNGSETRIFVGEWAEGMYQLQLDTGEKKHACSFVIR